MKSYLFDVDGVMEDNDGNMVFLIEFEKRGLNADIQNFDKRCFQLETKLEEIGYKKTYHHLVVNTYYKKYHETTLPKDIYYSLEEENVELMLKHKREHILKKIKRNQINNKLEPFPSKKPADRNNSLVI